jgi:hypothetical protein
MGAIMADFHSEIAIPDEVYRPSPGTQGTARHPRAAPTRTLEPCTAGNLSSRRSGGALTVSGRAKALRVGSAHRAWPANAPRAAGWSDLWLYAVGRLFDFRRGRTMPRLARLALEPIPSPNNDGDPDQRDPGADKIKSIWPPAIEHTRPGD